MSIYKKLNEVRKEFATLELKKSGWNDYSQYHYFELGDFLKPALELVDKVGLCPVISFTPELATMTVCEIDGDGSFAITSPFGSASLKACHEVQNIGAVETYQRRYLWMALLEIVTPDDLDTSKGPENKPAQPKGKGNDDDKPWYNDFDSHKAQMAAKIKAGESTPDSIIKTLSEKYKINKKVRELIQGLK